MECGRPSPGRVPAAARVRVRARVWAWPWPRQRGPLGAAAAEGGGPRACARGRGRAPGRAAPTACCPTAAGGTRSRSAPADPTTSPRLNGPRARLAARPGLGAGPAGPHLEPLPPAALQGPPQRNGRGGCGGGRAGTSGGGPRWGRVSPGFSRVLGCELESLLRFSHIPGPTGSGLSRDPGLEAAPSQCGGTAGRRVRERAGAGPGGAATPAP